jgi:uncharacterized protein with ParB-like and HNH nuclease domain
MNLPEPQSVTFTSLFAEIENGTIKIPQFQRDFVWSKTKSAKLLDSIVKGYPIGTFILWKTNERLRSIRNLGGVALPETAPGDSIKYLLDGQQRLTSLFVTLKGLTIQREEHHEDYSKFWVDLIATESQEIVLLDVDKRDPKQITGVPQEAKSQRVPSVLRRNSSGLGASALRVFSSFCLAA